MANRPDTTPLPIRLFLRASQNGTTLVGGQILADLCPDKRDRLWTGSAILVPSERLVVPSMDRPPAGLTLDQVLTSGWFDGNVPPWDREP